MKKFFKTHKLGIIGGSFIIIAAALILFIKPTPTPKTYIEARKIVVDDKFDLSTVPNGMVVWISGVPNFREEFTEMDSSLRYKKFDVGIWSESQRMVYRIRIPYYVRNMFELGMVINQKKIEKKRNPDKGNYVYPRKKSFEKHI